MAEFVEAKCDRNFDKITIVVGDVLVEIVKFMSSTARDVDEAIFLKNCPNIKKLTLFDMSNGEKVKAIFQQTCRQLKHLHHL